MKKQTKLLATAVATLISTFVFNPALANTTSFNLESIAAAATSSLQSEVAAINTALVEDIQIQASLNLQQSALEVNQGELLVKTVTNENATKETLRGE